MKPRETFIRRFSWLMIGVAIGLLLAVYTEPKKPINRVVITLYQNADGYFQVEKVDILEIGSVQIKL